MKRAREGLRTVMQNLSRSRGSASWSDGGEGYRKYVYVSGGVVPGSKQFVENTLKANAARLNLKRELRPHQVTVAGLDSFYYIRPQRGAPAISVPEAAVDNK